MKRGATIRQEIGNGYTSRADKILVFPSAEAIGCFRPPSYIATVREGSCPNNLIRSCGLGAPLSC
jgi:hypothetical protein